MIKQAQSVLTRDVYDTSNGWGHGNSTDSSLLKPQPITESGFSVQALMNWK